MEDSIEELYDKITSLSLRIDEQDKKIEENHFRLEKIEWINCIKECLNIYFEKGPRSPKKVDFLHNFIKKKIDLYIPENWKTVLEKNVKSKNATGYKKCDIVVLDENENVKIIFPTKFIVTNYKQNKNNFWECLTGECFHLHILDSSIHIVPINIILSETPYLDSNSKIKKIETITYEESFEVYNELVIQKVCSDILNIIIDVEQVSKIGEKYDTSPEFIGIEKINTMKDIVKKLI